MSNRLSSCSGRWDGAFPLFDAETEAQELAQLGEAVRYLGEVRQDRAQPFDIICTGITPGDDPAQAAQVVNQRAALGATWWLEAIAPYRFGQGFDGQWPLEALRERILQGPPRTLSTS